MTFSSKKKKRSESEGKPVRSVGRPPTTEIGKLIAESRSDAAKRGHAIDVVNKSDSTAELLCSKCGASGGCALYPPPGRPKFSGFEVACAG